MAKKIIKEQIIALIYSCYNDRLAINFKDEELTADLILKLVSKK